MMGSKTVNYSVALDPKRNKYSTWKAAKDRMLFYDRQLFREEH